MAAVAIDKVSVKVVLVGKVGYYLPQSFLAVGIEDVVYKLYDDFGYIIVKDDCRMFKCYVHNQWGYDHRHISGGGLIKL